MPFCDVNNTVAVQVVEFPPFGGVCNSTSADVFWDHHDPCVGDGDAQHEGAHQRNEQSGKAMFFLGLHPSISFSCVCVFDRCDMRRSTVGIARLKECDIDHFVAHRNDISPCFDVADDINAVVNLDNFTLPSDFHGDLLPLVRCDALTEGQRISLLHQCRRVLSRPTGRQDCQQSNHTNKLSHNLLLPFVFWFSELILFN